jgi:hypothetical protein
MDHPQLELKSVDISVREDGWARVDEVAGSVNAIESFRTAYDGDDQCNECILPHQDCDTTLDYEYIEKRENRCVIYSNYYNVDFCGSIPYFGKEYLPKGSVFNASRQFRDQDWRILIPEHTGVERFREVLESVPSIDLSFDIHEIDATEQAMSGGAPGGWIKGVAVSNRDDGEYEIVELLEYGKPKRISERKAQELLKEDFGSQSDQILSNLKSAGEKSGKGQSDATSSRRRFLLRVGATVVVGNIAEYSLESAGTALGSAANGEETEEKEENYPPAYFEQFWPDSLYNYASENIPAANQMYWDSIMSDFNKFVDKSTNILAEEVDYGDTVHLMSYFFRALDGSILKTIDKMQETAREVNLYALDPIEGRGGDSTLELNTDREVIIFKHLVNDDDTKDTFINDGMPWKSVSIVSDKSLNRIRANFHALRMMQLAIYLTDKFENVHFFPMHSPEKAPLRGRIIESDHEGESIAAFVRLEKGIVGTSNMTKGHVTKDNDFIRELNEERQKFMRTTNGKRDPYNIDELEQRYELILQKLLRYIGECESSGKISPQISNELEQHADKLRLEHTWERYRQDDLEVWYKNYKKELLEPIQMEIQELLAEEAGSFAEAESKLSVNSSEPAAIYEKALEYQNLK